jgi:restriction system protein
MNIWLVRAGKEGQYELKFIQDNKIYLTWDNLNYDLRKITDKDTLKKIVSDTYSINKTGKINNWSGQIWTFANKIKIDDWIVLPSKLTRTINIGLVKSEYNYVESNENYYKHFIKVEWFTQDIPRDNFDEDILYSFGSAMTICRIKRNNAEKRIKEMSKNDWKVPDTNYNNIEEIENENFSLDLNDFISDEISKRIIQKFKGPKMENLIKEILEAKGFTTYRSPEGRDNWVDLLASDGILGFGKNKICVQVKTSETQIDRSVLDQLIGTMSNFGADFGLLVSWYGFKSSVKKEIPKQFFKVRLWDSKKLLKNYLKTMKIYLLKLKPKSH